MLERILEPEVMDSESEAIDYDSMDDREGSRCFGDDFLTFAGFPFDVIPFDVLDVGAGTAQIPIEMVRRDPRLRITAIDLAEQMLVVGRRNVVAAAMAEAIKLELVDAKRMPYHDGR